VSELREHMLAGTPLGCRVVDCHGHLGPCPNFHIPAHSPAAIAARMDRVGVDILCVSSHTAIYSDFRAGNDETAAAVDAFPARFVGAVVLNAHYPDDLAGELDRCLAHGGFRMIKLHSSLGKFKLASEACEPIWREAERRGLPVLVHSWEGSADCGAAACERVAEKHPGVPLILGHSLAPNGYPEACRLAQTHANVYLDTATSMVNYGQLADMVERTGPDKILFGSDTPFLDPAPQAAKVVFARLSDDEKRKILGQNAAQLLGL